MKFLKKTSKRILSLKNKLLRNKRKVYNLFESSSSSDTEVQPEVYKRFKSSSVELPHIPSEPELDSELSFEEPRVRKQRSHSQRSTRSHRTPCLPAYCNDSSDDEAFLNNSDNFIKSTSRPVRRQVRRKKTSSLRRRQPGIQTVPDSVEDHHTQLQSSNKRRRSVTPFDTTLEDNGNLSIEWIESEYLSTDTQSSDLNGIQVISERSLLIANAETEDALTESDCHPDPASVFKMPFPVSYRPNPSKRKLAEESDEEYISKTFRRPVKRNCIRYFY